MEEEEESIQNKKTGEETPCNDEKAGEEFDVSNYVEVSDTDTEDAEPITPVFTESASVVTEKLVPTFVMSAPKPFSVRPKGQSRANAAKGKRPRILPLLGTIDGETLLDMSTSKTTSHDRQWYNHALISQEKEKIFRTKNTLILRIEELNQRKQLSLVDVYKVYQKDFAPIAIAPPSEMSRLHLSEILKINRDSNFISTMFSSLDLQDTMRKTILDVKKLPTCSCGYIYIHPSVTFSKHVADYNFLCGRQPGLENLALVPKVQALEYLNAIRYFLEIIYENLNN